MNEDIEPSRININDLPDEVLEYILSLIPPYKDLQDCMLVCKRWHRNVQSVIRHKKIDFLRSISNFNVKWQSCHESSFPKLSSFITRRYSHAACSNGNYMYVFGGCTCTSTTFNDLWRLDLSERRWSRLLSMGSYPSPKACSTLVHYRGSLILFGGWTHPSPLPLHQAWRTYNELHIYDIVENRWSCIVSPTEPPPALAGHSATIHGDCMIVFGGLQGINGGSNEVWCLDLNTHSWTRKETSTEKPSPRYGQSQIYLDDSHLLIIGGWGVPPVTVMSDIWLLDMSSYVWQWTEVTVHNPLSAASHLWCHPACRVEDYVVVLSRNPVLSRPPPIKWSSYSWGGVTANFNQGPDRVDRQDEGGGRDLNVNGRRGSLWRAPPSPPGSPGHPPGAPAVLRAFRDDSPDSRRRRERQLELLRKMEWKLRGGTRRSSAPREAPAMALFVLDIGAILGTRPCQAGCSTCATWLPVASVPNGGPFPTILHSLVPGHGELVMFGGVEKDVFQVSSALFDSNPDNPDNVSNSLYFITAPLPII